MTQDQSGRLSDLQGICTALRDARRAAHDLESRRDALLRRLRAAGVSCTTLASMTGLSPGRVTQIVQAGRR